MSGETLAVTAAAGLWCRACGAAARIEGDAEMGKAVHAGTGGELGADGHQCAPVDFLLPSMLEAAARRRATGPGCP